MTTNLLDRSALQLAYPRPKTIPQQRPWIRANFATTVNGVIQMEGRSFGVSGPPDKTVFRFLRSISDAILVGALTAQAEKYASPIPEPHSSKAPLLVVATNSLNIEDSHKIFNEESPPLIATSNATFEAYPSKIERLSHRARFVAFGNRSIDFPQLFSYLRSQGITTLLCEGGPKLVSQLLIAELVDEICLTISPRIGNGTPTGFANIGSSTPIEMHLESSFEVDGYLFCRYMIAR